MPPCTHCEFTRCPKCGHDCGQAPKKSAISENKRIADWIRTTPRVRGILISINSSSDLARIADAIEAGDSDAGKAAT